MRLNIFEIECLINTLELLCELSEDEQIILDKLITARDKIIVDNRGERKAAKHILTQMREKNLW
jgi:hypothetical protein